MKKQIYNQQSTESHDQARIIGGSPDGIINYERTNHKWATSLYKIMRSYNWQPGEVDVGQDKIKYPTLTPEHHRMYDLVLAQLISNDSIQTNQLMDSINQYITSPVVNACLAEQAAQEALHAQTYSVMAEDICGDTDRIFAMHKYDPELYRKNQSVSDMYSSLYSGTEPSITDLLKAFCANQILEELVFPGGFVAIFSIGHIMIGSAKEISLIERDESGAHVPLFKNMFRTACIENNINLSLKEYEPLVKEFHDMIHNMVEAEIRWTNYITKGVLGFSEQSIQIYVEHKGNSVCKNLGIQPLYKQTDGGPLQKLLEKFSLLKSDIKTNFMESKVVDYDMSGLDMSDL